MRQARDAEAVESLRQALSSRSSNHDARLTLAGLFAEAGKSAEALAVLGDGLGMAPGHTGFTVMTARIQAAGGAYEAALKTLEHGPAGAAADADYNGFLAAMLQKAGRHDDAVKHYLVALNSNPAMASWLVGIGISLEALHKPADAAEAFQRAVDTGSLSGEIGRFASDRVAALRQAR
jgi:MSHA biogenesis protein MshN